MKKKCYIIAGPNGAGKTTFANEFLPIEAECLNFINADLIAQGLSPFQPSKKAIAAGLSAEQIYFEIATVPLSKDAPSDTEEKGKTYIAFETIKKIKASISMKGAHCVIRPSRSGSGLPRSIGVCRA